MRGNDVNMSPVSLPPYLKILFGLAGATLSLPSLALTCLINDQIAIPIMYLPAYYAVAFLPYSFKPLYSLVTNWLEYSLDCPRHSILSFLLFGSGMTIFSLGFVSKGSILTTFILSFTSGLFTSWSDLLLSFVLLQSHPQLHDSITSSPISHPEEDQVHLLSSMEDDTNIKGPIKDHAYLKSDDSVGDSYSYPVPKSADLSFMQIEAATCRNVGSYVASLVAFLAFLYQYIRNKVNDDTAINEDGSLRLNPTSVMIFLTTTAFLPWCSIIIVQRYKDKFVNTFTASDPYEGYSTFCAYNHFIKVLSLISFQLALVLAALRSLMIAHYSVLFWNVLFGFVSIIFILSITSFFGFISCNGDDSTTLVIESKDTHDENVETPHGYKMKRICLYILLRNAIPSPTTLLSSFIYLTFSQSPILLQALYIMQLLMTSLASWMYQKHIAKYYTSGRKLKHVIICMTILNTLCILSFAGLFRINSDLHRSDTVSFSFTILFILVSLCYSFVGELSFLPNVILATITAANGISNQGASMLESKDQIYAFLVSCINFGDQISAWITVPLIEALSVNRDNGWKHMDQFLWLCAILGIVSLWFLPLL